MRKELVQNPAFPTALSRRKHLVALALLWPGVMSWAQDTATPAARSGTVAQAPASRQSPPPAWKTLSPEQREALAPLAPVWGEISSNRKRKWIALSANFKTLSPADKATLQGRMKEWASLSTADRNRARLNFSQTQELSSAEKKAQWEAYQSLSPERKRQLAAQAGTPAPGTAPAVTKRLSGKLAPVPTTRSEPTAAPAKP
jgi:hypothetical protein